MKSKEIPTPCKSTVQTVFIMNMLADLKKVFPDKNLVDLIYDARRFREPTIVDARVSRMTDEDILTNVKFYHKAKVKDKT